MASTVRSTTPPPPRVRTPQTPRWGDNFIPYSPRKSARISQLSAGSTTPHHRPTRNSIHSSPSSDTSPKVNPTPSSPQTAKKRAPRPSLPEMGGRRVSGALTKASADTAASALGLPPSKDDDKLAQSTSITSGNGMLPTPVKTPKHRPGEIAPAVRSVARNLFAVRPAPDEVMPSPRKGRKKYSGLTLDSFEAEEDSTPIPIYTDSHERIPEVDNSLENPFYGPGKAIAAEPTKRSSKRRKVISVDGEGEKDVEELVKRDDGMVATFRGKTTFQKFADPLSDSEPDEPEASTASPRRTRSSIKPRLLFPTAERPLAKNMKAHTTEDEEADTDIDEQKEASTPTSEDHKTPKAPKFALFTPPTTVRTTRSMMFDMNEGSDADHDMTDVPSSPSGRAATRLSRSSVFEDWSLGRTTPSDSKKRATESTSSGVAKRARS